MLRKLPWQDLEKEVARIQEEEGWEIRDVILGTSKDTTNPFYFVILEMPSDGEFEILRELIQRGER